MTSAPELTTTIASVRSAIAKARESGRSIGLVPTMGALHAGHAELIRACRRDFEFVIVSIFVNPTQFGPSEDYSHYPRSLDDDLQVCTDAGASVVFAPSADEIYPPGPPATYVEVPGLSDVLEGAIRPGHFRGVATVVLKLFNIVAPDASYFGEKDYQQLLVIRRMVADLNVAIAIRGVPTVRESDGLAMSSRNRYLSPDERTAATILSKALREAVDAVRGGERSADRVRQIVRSCIESDGRARIDYAEVADANTLAALSELGEGPAVALLAARVGPARLIDNAFLLG